MRLLYTDPSGQLRLTGDLSRPSSPYAILSHTWAADDDEVTFEDIENSRGANRPDYSKLRFCIEQAKKDGLQYSWVDTCCINKANSSELQEALNSMFVWYRDAAKCYVYLLDVE